jgi:hypothetical protein
MSREEFEEMDQKDMFMALGSIKDHEKMIYKAPVIPGRVFE